MENAPSAPSRLHCYSAEASVKLAEGKAQRGWQRRPLNREDAKDMTRMKFCLDQSALRLQGKNPNPAKTTILGKPCLETRCPCPWRGQWPWKSLAGSRDSVVLNMLSLSRAIFPSHIARTSPHCRVVRVTEPARLAGISTNQLNRSRVGRLNQPINSTAIKDLCKASGARTSMGRYDIAAKCR